MTTLQTSRKADSLPPAPPTITDEAFGELLASRAQMALRLAAFVAEESSGPPTFNRPLLGEILHQATELEEILDAYGARTNRRWRSFRSTIAAAKLFANVNYVLLHIRHSMSAYRLLTVDGDFAAATEEAIGRAGRTLQRISRRFVDQARRLGMSVPDPTRCECDFQESLPPGRLAVDASTRKAGEAGEMVTYLATAFLNQAAESELLHIPERVEPSRYAECFPNPVSEEALRRLQHQFHNLQSLYDSYVSGTDTERRNPDLPVLRGHISVIFHLLEVATLLGHHYERHVMGHAPPPPREPGSIVGGEELLDMVMKYPLVYSSRYLIGARELCHEMLRRYAKVARIEVAGPRYRGFHVRPSTLVAKIVHHYGSKVRMELDGATFDASSPMDIFRANEKINREKRRWLTARVAELDCVREPGFGDDPVKAVRRVVLTLAERDKVVIYHRPLPIQEPNGDDEDKTPLQYVLDEVKRLQATGMIDIDMAILVTFVGDRRVLKDLELLAESGYGEDNFGNNTPLPKDLSYLRR